MDTRTMNLAHQIIDELRERNVEPTPINVLAAATDIGLSSEAAQDIVDIINRQIEGNAHG